MCRSLLPNRATVGGANLVCVKTQQQKAEERRQEKLAQIQEQVDEGSLTIRKMTDRERAKHPPKPRKPKGQRR